MTRPFTLQPVLDLMQERTDKALQQLARLIAAEQDARARLEMLQQYRADYAQRFQEAAQRGISHGEWHNYRSFLARLDEAVAQQAQAVVASERHTAAGQANWQGEQTRLKAIDTLAERHREQELGHQRRQEQKISDEFAARRPGGEDTS